MSDTLAEKAKCVEAVAEEKALDAVGS